MRSTRLFTLLAVLVGLLVIPAAAQAADRDHDGLPDRWEKRNHLSTKKDSSQKDNDGDRVDNQNEYREGTKPRDKDSDNDGKRDGREDRDRDKLNNAAEDASGNDPRDRDTDGDGIVDGKEQAGVVTAYEDGELTIDLSNGGTVSGKVTEDTEVECVTEDSAEDDQTTEAGASEHPGGPEGPRGERGPRGGEGGTDGRHCGDREECPEGTLAVGARINEASLSVREEGAVWRHIVVLTEGDE